MFARGVELHLRPAPHRQARIHAGVGEVGVIAVHIARQAVLVGFDEFVEMRGIGVREGQRAAAPASGWFRQ